MSEKPEEGVSPDLPYELQSKMFDQLAAMSLAGAGLTVTLIGSTLRGAPGVVWLAVIEFGIAALVCVTANVKLIEGLLKKDVSRARTKLMTGLATGLIGMGAGSLAMSVYLDGQTHDARPAEQPAAANAR